jgi:hypothetical protein
MSETHIKLDPIWLNAAKDAVNQFGFGSVIPHEWLMQAFEIKTPDVMTLAQFKKHQFNFLTCLEGFRDELLTTHKMALRNIHSVGYEIVHPKVQADYALSQAVSHIKKGLKKGTEILKHTRMDMLQAEDLRRSADVAATLGTLEALNRSELAASVSRLKLTDTREEGPQ